MPTEHHLKVNLEVGKMTCAACAASIESMLKSQQGVADAKVNYANRSVLLEYDSKLTSLTKLKSIVDSIGYELYIEEQTQAEREASEKNNLKILKRKLLIAVIFSLPVFVLSMFFHHRFATENIIMFLLSLPVIFYSGSGFYTTAFRQLKHGMANMDTLVAMGTGTAFVYSVFNTFLSDIATNANPDVNVYFESAVVIITLILLGRFLEERAKSRASSAIRKLMELQPKEIRVIRNNTELSIAAKDVLISDIILIKPGEKIPVDGIVNEGESAVDESMISGEAMPVEKKINAKVYAGCINLNGSLKITARKIGKETMLAQIIRLVQEAQASKPPVQKLADKISSVFVPVVILIALSAFAYWYFIAAATPAFSISISIAVLIIACPCALGLATPTALMVGMGNAAEKGILIKNAEQLEILHKINAIVFDKTGTITIGKPQLNNIIWQNDYDHTEEIAIMHALEKRSAHPLADAIVNHFKDMRLPYTNISDFKNISGMGVQGIYDKDLYLAGNLNFIIQNNIPLSENQKAEIDKLSSEGNSLILFASYNRLLAIIALNDKLKQDVAATINELNAIGIESYLLTGDNQKTAAIIASKAGIENVKAEVLPAGKADYIRELKQKHQVVAMVGDGINDAVALSQADIGIAMASGSDIAMESAGITLIRSDIAQLPKAIRLSAAILRTIRQNLFWAFIYNIISIPVAAGVLYASSGFLLNPMIAAAAMAFSSVSVVSNSLRLKRK